MPLPHPPVKNMTDFVVFCFVSIVAIVLLGAMVTVIVLEVKDPNTDTSSITSALADIVTTLIGALVGFIAGKGQGRSEVHDELDELAKARREQQEAKQP